MRRNPKEGNYLLAYDMKLMQPGCVLIQAMAGGTVDNWTLTLLGDWLTSRTPDMKLYEVTPEELEQLKVFKVGKKVRKAP